MGRSRKKRMQQELRFITSEATAESTELEQGLELLARLLLERWEAKHTEASRKERDRIGDKDESVSGTEAEVT